MTDDEPDPNSMNSSLFKIDLLELGSMRLWVVLFLINKKKNLTKNVCFVQQQKYCAHEKPVDANMSR